MDPSGTVSYSVTKSAVISAIGCIQLELDSQGLGDDIQVYALHPAGVLIDVSQSKEPLCNRIMCSTPMDPDVQQHILNRSSH